MPKPIVFIAALLLALPAFAQTRMPARQVEADTNMVNIAVSLPFTAQVALDWIDANWPAFSSESWSNLDPAEDTVQSVFDWVDDNWQAELDDSGWLFLDPESPTTQSVFDWIDAYMGIDTNDWGYLAPTASTAQATFTWLDERFSGFDPGAVIMPGSNIVGGTLVSNQWTGLMPGSNIVGGTLVSNQWTGLMPGSNIVGGTLVSNQWTGLMPGTNITGFALNDETSSWDPIEATPAGYSMVPLFNVWSTKRQAGAGYVWTLASAYEGVATNAPDSGFNPSTGVFTAPQTGYYYFVGVGQFWAAADNYAGLGLAGNPAEGLLQGAGTAESSSYPYAVDCCMTFGSSGSASSGSLFKYMEANDTMCLWFRASTGFTNWFKAFQGFALR
jgi:hypothetical protein